MRKQLTFLFSILVFAVSLSSCGFNRIMYEHLSVPDNYEQYSARIVKLHYEYEKNVLSEDFQRERFDDVLGVYLDVAFDSKEDIAPFYGVSASSLAGDCSEYTIRLEIIPENARELLRNGFFVDISPDSTITLRASSLIYQDGDFFYVSSLTYNGVEYLALTDGMENIIAMMDNEKSPL